MEDALANAVCDALCWLFKIEREQFQSDYALAH